MWLRKSETPRVGPSVASKPLANIAPPGCPGTRTSTRVYAVDQLSCYAFLCANKVLDVVDGWGNAVCGGLFLSARARETARQPIA